MTDTLQFRSANDTRGFTMLPNCVLQSRHLTSIEKVVYALLIHYARQEGRCFPGQDTLAAAVPCARETVSRSLQVLEDLKLITIQQRGQGKPNLYWIEPLTDQLVADVIQDHI